MTFWGSPKVPLKLYLFICLSSYKFQLNFFYSLEIGKAIKLNKGKKGKKPHGWISEDYGQDCIIDQSLLVT